MNPQDRPRRLFKPRRVERKESGGDRVLKVKIKYKSGANSESAKQSILNKSVIFVLKDWRGRRNRS